MKQFSFLKVGFLFALVLTIASCGMPLYSTDGYYEEAPIRREVYRGSVYGSGPVVYERDPYTGRYYEVNPYGGYSRPARPYYDRRSNNRYNNDRNYNQRYNNNNYGNNTYRNYPQTRQEPQRAPQSPQDAQRERDEAREKILGGKRS